MPSFEFSSVSDNSLLPLGERIIQHRDPLPAYYGTSAYFDITPIFEDGFRFGNSTETFIAAHMDGGISFDGSSAILDNGAPTITPFYEQLDFEEGPGLDNLGVFLDLNTERDSVVVTWRGVSPEKRDASAPQVFQLELIDRGAGDAEIIFRYENIQDPLTLLTVSFEMGLISSDGLSSFIWHGNSQDGQDQLDDRPGNTGVDGVWQFGLVDGALVQDDRLRATQTGTEENDHLYLQSQGGRLLGLAGDDVLDGAVISAPATRGAILNGGDGNDLISHGNAADTVIGGAGDDQVVSHERAYWPEINFADYIHGMDGNDTLSGGFGGDTIAGGAGDDVISGGMDDDFLFGGAGNDFLYGGRGRDNVWGGAGADRFFAASPGHSTTVLHDYNADEGDVLLLDGEMFSRDDIDILTTYRTVSDGTRVLVELAVEYAGPGATPGQKWIEFANAEQIDRIVIEFPADASGRDILTIEV